MRITKKQSTLNNTHLARYYYLWLRKSFCDSSKPLFKRRFIPSLARPWYSQKSDVFEVSSLHSFLEGFIRSALLWLFQEMHAGLVKETRRIIIHLAPCFDFAQFSCEKPRSARRPLIGRLIRMSASGKSRVISGFFRRHYDLNEIIMGYTCNIQDGVCRSESGKAVVFHEKGLECIPRLVHQCLWLQTTW